MEKDPYDPYGPEEQYDGSCVRWSEMEIQLRKVTNVDDETRAVTAALLMIWEQLYVIWDVLERK